MGEPTKQLVFKPRDPARISQITTLIQIIWQHQPDTRFLQLVYNLHHDYAIASKNQTDPFYVEDEKFVDFLWHKVKSIVPRAAAIEG